MNVYLINRTCIAAKNEKAAMHYYNTMKPRSEHRTHVLEVDKEETVRIPLGSLPDEEFYTETNYHDHGTELFVDRTFDWVLRHDACEAPYIIATGKKE